MHVATFFLSLAFAIQLVSGRPTATEHLEQRYNGGNADLAAMIAHTSPTVSSRQLDDAQAAAEKAMFRRISGLGGS
ncbi:hypothetical protein BKA65DRAFT_555405 [Rhexocercosporidium sp. MPI-PUGE-AT-0058]|nr:hypothetical protein BKA65DRAFT_555405 [Rhexocercosporidium sp. MPI-PUGE-AT-0058]